MLKEKLGDDVEINICYTDVRSFGKGYEEFYRKIRGMKTNFFRGRASEVRKANDHLSIDVFDTTTNKLFEIKTDMVVLVPALVPRADADEFARLLHLSQSGDGFFLEAHPKLRPVEFSVDGIYLCGLAHSPRPISEAIAQAKAAASKACIQLAKGHVAVEPIVSSVDQESCIGCGICELLCPYASIRTVKVGKKKKAETISASCKGCGICASHCPTLAIYMGSFSNEQIMAQIKAYGDSSQ